MRFYSLGPEAAGELGSQSIIGNPKERPHQVKKLHLELTFWPADDLIDAYTYVCSKRLATALAASTLTGFRLDKIDKVSFGDQFNISARMHKGETLAEFVWLKVSGKPGIDDFGLVQGPCALPLVVSESALQLLKSFDFNHCTIQRFYANQSLPAAS